MIKHIFIPVLLFASLSAVAQKLKARRYRNRRLGDFLKELDLTEGRATGIPTIQKSLRDNGSPKASIETDDDRTYFLMTIPCREDMIIPNGLETPIASDQDLDTRLLQILGQASAKIQSAVYQYNSTNKEQLLQILEQLSVKVWNKSKKKINKALLIQYTIDTLEYLNINPSTVKGIIASVNHPDSTEFRRKILNPLIVLGRLVMTNPDKPTSSKQKYTLTESGKLLFK